MSASWEDEQKKAAKDLVFHFYAALGYQVTDGEEDEKAFYDTFVELRSNALADRLKVELSTLKSMIEYTHDSKLQKLPYKLRFESLVNLIANNADAIEQAMQRSNRQVQQEQPAKSYAIKCGECNQREAKWVVFGLSDVNTYALPMCDEDFEETCRIEGEINLEFALIADLTLKDALEKVNKHIQALQKGHENLMKEYVAARKLLGLKAGQLPSEIKTGQ